jgi:hypothetical protein
MNITTANGSHRQDGLSREQQNRILPLIAENADAEPAESVPLQSAQDIEQGKPGTAENGRRKGEGALLLALAAGHTIRDAARMADIGERTAGRRMADPAFRKKLSDLRTELIERAADKLADATADAVATLHNLLSAEGDSVRLGAAKAILDLATKVRDNVESDARRTLEQSGNAQAPNRQPEIGDERLRTWFTKLAAEGFYSSQPDFPALYKEFQEQLTKAESNPRFHEVPPDYLPRLSEEERLESWRRGQFRSLDAAQFQMLRLTKRALEKHPDAGTIAPL